MSIPTHIRKTWWDAANERRGRLINKKYTGGGLTVAQEGELEDLQAIAGLILNRYCPIPRFPAAVAKMMKSKKKGVRKP